MYILHQNVHDRRDLSYHESIGEGPEMTSTINGPESMKDARTESINKLYLSTIFDQDNFIQYC